MKKLLVFAFGLVMILMAESSFAQVKYDKGNFLINLGVGSSYNFAGGTPFIASGEYLINDAISIGGYVGFTSYGYRYSTYRVSYTFFDFGARGAYHFSKHLNLKTDKLDLYGGAMIGYVVSNFSNNANITYSDPYASALRGGILAGARWYFTPGFGANAELQAGGITPFMIGLTFKL